MNARDTEKQLRPTNISKYIMPLLIDRPLKASELANTVNISIPRAFYILHNIFGIKKVSAQCIQRLLIINQKHIWMNIAQEC